jgi:hypothetical protein
LPFSFFIRPAGVPCDSHHPAWRHPWGRHLSSNARGSSIKWC